jgi:thiol-disulfide isomerase/thioredoxin
MTRREAISLVAAPVALAQAPKPRVPRPSPEFAVNMPDGQTLLFSQHKGKVLLVEFLLTTCPHCQEASRITEKLYKELGPKGFQPVGVAINDMAKMLVPDYIKNLGLTFPVGFSLRDPVYNYLEHSPMMQLMMPTVVFVDRKFQIRAQHMGGTEFFQKEEANMRSMVETLLAEGGKTPAAARKKAS